MPRADLDWVIEKQYFEWQGHLRGMIFDDVSTACPDCIGYVRAALYYGNANIGRYLSLNTKARSRVFLGNDPPARRNWFDISGTYFFCIPYRTHYSIHAPQRRLVDTNQEMLGRYLRTLRRIPFHRPPIGNLRAQTSNDNHFLDVVLKGLISLYYRIGNCGEHGSLALTWFYANAPRNWTIYRIGLSQFSFSKAVARMPLFVRRQLPHRLRNKQSIQFNLLRTPNGNYRGIFGGIPAGWKKMTYDHCALIVQDDLGNIAICDPWAAYYGYIYRPTVTCTHLNQFINRLRQDGWNAGPGERDYLAWLEEVWHPDILSDNAGNNAPLPRIGNPPAIFTRTRFRGVNSWVWQNGTFVNTNLQNANIRMGYTVINMPVYLRRNRQQNYYRQPLSSFAMEPTVLRVRLTGTLNQRRQVLRDIGAVLGNGHVFE